MCSWLCRSDVVAKTDSRPCVFRPPSLAGRVTFSCLPKESNQRERHPRGRGRRASMPGDCASALRRFADGTSMCRQRTRAHPARAPARLFPPRTRRAERGPGKSRARQSSAGPRDAAEGGDTRPGTARWHRAASAAGHGCAVGGTRPPAAHRARRARHQGALSLRTSLGKQGTYPRAGMRVDYTGT